MKTRTRIRVLLSGIIAALAVGSTSHATISQINVSSYNGVAVSFSVQGVNKSVWATAFLADWISGAPLPPSHTDPFVTFCLDVNNTMASGYWDSGGFANVPLTSQTSPAVRQANSLYRAANLYQHYVSSVVPSSTTWSSATSLQKLNGAALQLAIWEVLYETSGTFDVDNGAGFNLNSGTVLSAYLPGGYTYANLISRANQMLTENGGQWSAADPNIGTTFWNAVNADGSFRSSQDLIGPFSAVPEPGTYIAGSLLLLPLLVNAIRRRQQKRAS